MPSEKDNAVGALFKKVLTWDIFRLNPQVCSMILIYIVLINKLMSANHRSKCCIYCVCCVVRVARAPRVAIVMRRACDVV